MFDTEKLRDLANNSNDGHLRDQALLAADIIDNLREANHDLFRRAEAAEARERALLETNQIQRDATVEAASLRHKLKQVEGNYHDLWVQQLALNQKLKDVEEAHHKLWEQREAESERANFLADAIRECPGAHSVWGDRIENFLCSSIERS